MNKTNKERKTTASIMIKRICFRVFDVYKTYRIASVPPVKFYTQSYMQSSIKYSSWPLNENRCRRLQENNTNIYRWKHSKKDHKKDAREESDSEEDVDDDEDTDSEDKRTVTAKIPTLRLDDLLLRSLYFKKSKTETLFKEDKIRINGEKIFRKSVEVNMDDVIDIVVGFDPVNKDNLRVSRVKVESISGGAHSYSVVCSVNRVLYIENYSGNNAFGLEKD